MPCHAGASQGGSLSQTRQRLLSTLPLCKNFTAMRGRRMQIQHGPGCRVHTVFISAAGSTRLQRHPALQPADRTVPAAWLQPSALLCWPELLLWSPSHEHWSCCPGQPCSTAFASDLSIEDSTKDECTHKSRSARSWAMCVLCASMGLHAGSVGIRRPTYHTCKPYTKLKAPELLQLGLQLLLLSISAARSGWG